MTKRFNAVGVLLSGALLFTFLLVMPRGALASEKQSGPGKTAEITRGAVTGQTQAKGYNHPNQYLHVRPVQIADNMEPVIQHPDQDKAAREKLAALEKRFGRKPNILIFLMDDVGWMDPGFNGGGEAVGNPT